MRHKKRGRKFGRKRDQKRAFLKELSRALFLEEKITITEPRAKEIRAFVEKAITRAKKGDLASRRYLRKYFSENLVKKIVDDITPGYQERNGGYTRITKLGRRKGDAAKMAIIELVK
ncbi:MAG: 50S ribosomal protein L17 [Parcubacteria group bacterium CG11_big_fil_rev_8_21_14_0_20_39_14]|nr:MAG: 50S ribosomal protein L17 [Parcubacteria group bacterium CG11_big_fil_rev_8_21_14_0_20_39_14]PIS35035.1 MAG: 50S ribosomal protein L17 [Parcubacteria group bacterium CG08_land_8_20_14_0_20_38_56]